MFKMYNPNKLNEFVDWLRPLVNGDVIDSKEFNICEFISKCDKQFLDDDMISELNPDYKLKPCMRSSKAIYKICRTEGWDKFEGFNRIYAILSDYLNPPPTVVKIKNVNLNKLLEEENEMIINTKMFLESPQTYIDIAKNGTNIYIQLDNGTKLKLGKQL